MALNVVAIGDLVVDIVVAVPELATTPGHYQKAHFITVEPGGSGNFLIAGARLGMTMTSIGTLGADMFGDAALTMLRAEGVETRHIVQVPGSTSLAIVTVDDRAQHVLSGVYGTGAALAIDAAWDAPLRAADALFASSYSLREPRMRAATLHCLSQSHALDTPVFFDGGPELHWLDDEARDAALAYATVVLLTEEELRQSALGEAADLLRRGPAVVVVKRGAAGCQVWTADGVLDAPGFRVPVRDTVAAGDSFAAAFIYGYLDRRPPTGDRLPPAETLQRAATIANAMGAAKVQKRGTGRQVPTAAEVRAVLAQFRPDLALDESFGAR